MVVDKVYVLQSCEDPNKFLDSHYNEVDFKNAIRPVNKITAKIILEDYYEQNPNAGKQKYKIVEVNESYKVDFL